MLEKIPAEDSFWETITKQLLTKLYDSGLVNEKENLESAKKITVSAFMRRRFLVQVKLLKFVENLQEAETFIQHGHFMIGNEIIKDPNFLVSRKMTDHITWNDQSKVKRKVQEFNNQQDDFETM